MNDEAVYIIRIAGRLGPEWSERFAGMSLVVREEPIRGTTTILTGPADQAALMGVLGRLYEMGATILAVERRDPADATDEIGCSETGTHQGS